MDHPPPRRRLQLVRDLAQQLVAEAEAGVVDRLEDARGDERAQRGVQLIVGQRRRGRQQRALDDLARRGRGRPRRPARPASRTGARRAARRAPRAPTRAPGRRRARPPGPRAPAPRRRAGCRRCGRRAPRGSRPAGRSASASISASRSSWASGRSSTASQVPGSKWREVATTTTPLAGDARQQRPRGVVEPVQVLGDHDRRAGLQIRLDGLVDLVLEPLALGRGGHVAGGGLEPEHRRQQRDGRRRPAPRARPPRRGRRAGEPPVASGRRPQRRSSRPRTGCSPASAWNGEPCRRTVSSSSVSAATRRDLPTPGSPHTSTPFAPDSSVARRARSSPSRPISGAVQAPRRAHVALPDDAERLQRLRRALDGLRLTGLELEVGLHQLADLVGDDHRAGVGQRLVARADVGGEAEDLVLVELAVDGAVVHADAERERLAGLGAAHLADRLHQRQRGAHRPLGVVLVRDRVAEGRQHAVALVVDDVALEALLDHVHAGAAGSPPSGRGRPPANAPARARWSRRRRST